MSPCSALVTVCHPLPGRLAETGLLSRPPPPLAVGSTCSRGVPRGIFGRTVPKHPGPQSESSQEESPGSGREVTVFAQCSRQPGARFHLCCSVPPRFPSHLTHRDPHSQVKLISMLRTAPPGSRAVLDRALWEPSVTCRPPTHVPCRVRPDLRSRHAGLGARGLHARWSAGTLVCIHVGPRARGLGAFLTSCLHDRVAVLLKAQTVFCKKYFSQLFLGV